MRKGTFIATVALLIAIAGAIVAFAAYFKRRNCVLCDELDGEMPDDELADFDYYATQVNEEVEECACESVDTPDEPEVAPVAAEDAFEVEEEL